MNTVMVPPNEASSLMEVIARAASDPTVDVTKLERLNELYERMKAREAKVAYMTELAQMQLELPVIKERGAIKIGTATPQKYALWEDINDQIKPVLAAHGFALSFRCGFNETKIMVTGVLSHRDGHSEETTIQLPSDSSGSKNAVQAVGSSTSYGKRYTAQALLNLTSRGEDDDGVAAGTKFISEDQIAELKRRIRSIDGASDASLCRFMKVEALEAIPAKDFTKAMVALEIKEQAAAKK
jgi:ERF superfamily protein